MSLQIENSWTKAIQMTLKWFEKKGLDADEHYVDNCCEDSNEVQEWSVVSVSTTVYLSLLRTEASVRFQVYAPILKIQDKNIPAEVYKEMLVLNATTLSCCSFGIEDDGSVVIAVDRSTKELNHEGIDEMFENVSNNASHYAEELLKTYTNAFRIIEMD